MTGFFEGSSDFDPGAGTVTLTSAGSADIFVSKLNASWEFVYAKALGGLAFDNGLGVAVDGNGNVYTTGYFDSSGDFDPGAGTVTLTSTGAGYDVFVSKLLGDGSTSPTTIGAKEFGAGAVVGSGQVTLFNQDGSPRYTLTPFAGFTGGIRTTAADFNGDGVADLVAATGPGRSTSLRIFDGKTQSELFTMDPFEASFKGGIYVATGDLTGDGTPDFAISPDEGGGPRVRVFNGKTFTQIADIFGIDDPNFRGGARAALSDLSGDGKADLLVAAGFGGGPRLALYNGATLTSTGGPKFVGDFFVFEQSLRNGVFLSAGDVNGDGFADVMVGGGPGGGPRVFGLSGKDLTTTGTQTQVANFFAGDPNSRGGVRLTMKNLDGDNFSDIVVGSGTGAGSRLIGYRGSQTPINGTPTSLAFDFDAFPGFSNGVFVG